MTWPIVYTPVTSLAGTEYLIAESAAGAGMAVPASLVAYKGSDGDFHLDGVKINAAGAGTILKDDGGFFFRNAAGTLTVGVNCGAIACDSIESGGNITFYGNSVFGNGAGDTHLFGGAVTLEHTLAVNGNAALGNTSSDVVTFNGDANYTVGITSSKPRHTFDSGDWFEYDRSTNTFNFGVGSATVATIAAAGITAVAGTFTGNVSINTGGADQKLIMGLVDTIVRNGSNGALTIYTNAQGILFAPADGVVGSTGSLRPAMFTVATVPSASAHAAGAMIYVSNESGGAVPAFSDGSVWKRVTDRATIS